MIRQRATALFVGLALGLGSLVTVVALVAAQEGSPVACPAASADASRALVQRMFEDGVSGGDLSVFDEVIAPDVLYHGAAVSDESGLEALKRIYGEALTGFPGIQYQVVTTTAEPDKVAARLLVRGVHAGEFRGIAPSGNEITWNQSVFAEVECGKIVELWAEIGQLDRLRQLGELASDGPAARMAGAELGMATPVAASAASCDPASREEMLALVDRFRDEVYNDANLAVMPELMTTDYIQGSANGPDAIGIEAGGQRINTFLTALPDLEWTFDDVVVEGDRVSARWTTRGTHDGDLAGFPPSGNPIAFTGISTFTISCGKIVAFQTEMDAAGMIDQAGAPVTRQDS
jgi:predicted ester cyclase